MLHFGNTLLTIDELRAQGIAYRWLTLCCCGRAASAVPKETSSRPAAEQQVRRHQCTLPVNRGAHSERSRLFLRLARECGADRRVEFEAFLEAAIVFARAAVHRLQFQLNRHPRWIDWWDGLRGNPSIEFFRIERDSLLKNARGLASALSRHIRESGDPHCRLMSRRRPPSSTSLSQTRTPPTP